MQAIVPYASRAASIMRFMNRAKPVVTRIGKFTGDYYLWRGAKAGINMLRGMYHRNKLYKAIRASGQGRVQNWKQIKQTGTGLKIRRRRRGGRKNRIRRRRRYRRRKYRYLSWLYKNRPVDYRKVYSSTDVFYVYNMPMLPTLQITYPSNSITTITVSSSMPSMLDNVKTNYMCYKINYNFLFAFTKYGSTGLEPSSYTHAYVRVLVFRKWGSNPTISNYLWSMFNRPYLLTSGYVKRFKRMWCANYNVQLYLDKLLRVSEDTNWVTQFKFNIYPHLENRYTNDVETNRWFYTIYLIGGFGAEDKFHNLWESGGADPNLTVRVKYDQIGYYRYTTGMNLTDADSKLYQPVGEPGPAGPLPTSISMEEDNEEVSGGTGNEPRGSDGASGSIPGPSSSFTILHDD